MIIYRDPTRNQDIIEAVYRWDDRNYTEIFRTGFRARDASSTTLDEYYNLEHHVSHGGAPADASPADTSVFVSTTRSTSWRPLVSSETILYRYEIFAPGGIDTVLTLGEHHAFPNQQEIAFVGAISPQYIRSARPYVAIPPEPGSQFPGYSPLGNRIFRYFYFNPNPTLTRHTTQTFMNRSRNIVCPRPGENMINFVFRSSNRLTRDIESPTEVPFADPSCAVASYVDCAFNFNWTAEAFMFTADQCLRINEAPGSTDDFIIKGPMSIGEFFPALQNTIFATGVDSAFTTTETNEVYMFRNNIYVLFNYESGKIIGGPKKITDGFGSLKNTIFEHGIDAAFASHRTDEAYLFKGDQYALINFAPGTSDDYLLNPPHKITDGFPSLTNTVFADGLDAGFRAKETNEAYIFKGDTYALINYAPGTNDDHIINQVTPITKGFYSMLGVIPRYPCGC